MAQIKVEAHGQYGVLDVGEQFFGLHVAATVPGSPQMVLDVPDAISPETAIQQLLDANVIVDGRPVHSDYQPLGWPVKGPAPFAAPGDTFPLVMAADCPARGHWGARPTRLGILDTGLDGGHVAFDGKDVQGDRTDGHGHGTHVASTAASAWGIASDSAIFMRNVLPNGNGSEAGVANGFRELADAGCDVISASLGGSPSQVIDAAVQYARQQGALVVCAAGNGGDAQPAGSPARAATISVYAVDRSERPATFTDGKGWATTGSQGVDITAAARGTRSGAMTMSGTSMACPHISGLLCLLRGAGLSPQACLDYLAGHRAAVAGCANGVLKLAADFGAAEGGAVDTDEARARFAAIQAECDRDGLRYYDIRPGDSRLDVEAFARIIQKSLGIVYAHAEAGLAALGKVDPGPVDPPAPVPGHNARADLQGFSYDAHWQGSTEGPRAVDWYPDPSKSGRSRGIPISMPAPGTVRRVSMVGPLTTAHSDPAFDLPILDNITGLWLPEGTSLHTAIWVADAGDYVAAFTHVGADVQEGHFDADVPFATTWHSGLESFADLLPDHIHLAWGNRRTMPANWNGDMGDLNARDFFTHYGFTVEIRPSAQECGPQDYMGRACKAGIKGRY